MIPTRYSGWIKLYRVLVDHDLWLEEPFSRGQAWVDLIMLANHATAQIRRRGIRVTVKRGQVGYSQEALAARWKWSKGKVIRFLNELKQDERISITTELKNIAISALITITNYEQYQGESTEGDTENGPKTKLKTVLEQECKEEKEKVIEKRFTPPAEAEVHAYMTEIGFTEDASRFIDFYASKGWMVGKNKMKDWKAAVRNWRRNDAGRGRGANGLLPQGAELKTRAEIEAML